MKSFKRAALLVLGIVLIGGCASMSSERGGSSSGASSNPPYNSQTWYPYYPNY